MSYVNTIYFDEHPTNTHNSGNVHWLNPKVPHNLHTISQSHNYSITSINKPTVHFIQYMLLLFVLTASGYGYNPLHKIDNVDNIQYIIILLLVVEILHPIHIIKSFEYVQG